MTKIDEAWTEYHEAECKAAIAYQEYWLERAKQENIIFGPAKNPNQWPYVNLEAQVGPHLVRFETNAKKFEGAYFYVQISGTTSSGSQWGPRWKPCKVKSERGWERMLKRLSAPVFV